MKPVLPTKMTVLVEKYVHIILHTLDRACVPLADALVPLLYVEIERWLHKQNCRLLAIGGSPDHIHLVVAYPPSVSPDFWVKNMGFYTEKWYQSRDFDTMYYKLRWQDPFVQPLEWAQVVPLVAYVTHQKAVHTYIDTCSELSYWQQSEDFLPLQPHWQRVEKVVHHFMQTTINTV